ncbi:MAG: universal stress protein [Chitinophagaceae bacterium]|nr:universal stress protein [Chitinophagaceae bacterium]
MKKIIVATDFSAEADNALQYTAAAAAEQQYELVLFHLHNMSIHAMNARISGEALYELITAQSNQLNETATFISSAYKIPVVAHFATGNFFEELNKCIAGYNADLVVMGMAGKYLEQDLLGDTTTAAIHRLKTPILAIPLEAKYKGIKQILFAADIVRGIHKHILDQVKTVAADFGSTVEVFHVREKIDELISTNTETEKISEAMSGISYYHKNIESKRVIDAIREEIVQSNADLLVMVPYKYGFWNSLVHRSKTRMMASGNNVPLLSIPV